MTIARDFTGRPGTDDGGVLGVVDAPVPAPIRAERLAQQVASFERAGYRLETWSGFHAVVVRPSESSYSARRVVLTAGLCLVPRLLGLGKRYHRVIIAVDGTGSVRMA